LDGIGWDSNVWGIRATYLGKLALDLRSGMVKVGPTQVTREKNILGDQVVDKLTMNE